MANWQSERTRKYYARIAALPLPLDDALHLAAWLERRGRDALPAVERALRYHEGLERTRIVATMSWPEIEAMGERIEARTTARDPWAGLCRDPENCNGSCRRDPACNE